ncbi:MAG: hypothetical protein QOJ91_1833 [Sphingomonadales bacterium]|jgi:hypothetical protein|nr:hypothetical protein [Sphingomonadales bacterium]
MTFYGPVGAQSRVNGARAGHQYASSSAALGDGGYVVIWVSLPGTGYLFKGQRFDAGGNPVGSEFQVASLATSNQSLLSAVTGLQDGGFVVAWENGSAAVDGSGSAIQAQRFDSSGRPVGSAFVVNDQTSSNQYGVALTTLADGHVLASWTTAQPAAGGTLSEIKARLFDASGTPLGSEFLVNATTAGSQSTSVVAATANGGFIATWLSGTGTSTLLYGQLFDSAGNKSGAELVLGGEGSGYPTEASVTQLADGRFVVAWRNFPDSGFTQTISGQILSSSGAKIGGEFLISNPGGNPQTGSPQVKALPDGGFVATWSNDGGTDVSTAVWARIYDASGTPGASFLANTAATLFEGSSRTLVTTGGDIVVAWTTTFDFNDDDVSARFIALNKAPVIQSDGGGATASFAVAEDQRVVTQIVATDRVGPAPVSYAIAGGADAALFAIDSTGHLTFLAAPDAQAPADADLDNVYQVVVTASDGELADSQALSVTVAGTGRSLLIASSPQVAVLENGLAVTRISATDAAATFAITGGADAARFAIDSSTGMLSFVAAPNFEAPADSGADNVYDVQVTASAADQSAVQALSVTVGNVNEGPAFTTPAALTMAENSTTLTFAALDTEGDPITWKIVGGADADKVLMNATTGVLTFFAAPNFEAPADAGVNGVYDLIVRAADSELSVTQAFAITIANVNEGTTITSNGAGATAAFSLPENQLVATTVTARDNPTGTNIVYSIFGGSDASKFAINAATGVLSFVTAPNYEATTDFNRDRIYDVTVKATDGTFSDTQALSITITDVNEPFSITAYGGGDTGAFSVAENTNANYTISTDEQDAGTLTFTIVGGADAARFKIGPAFLNSGSITFLSTPDFESPTDSNGDNVYYVTVRASDGTYSDTQTLAVTVTNVQENVRITSLGGSSSAFISMAENQILATTVTAVDPDNGAVTYSLSGGADSAKFVIDSATGALSFLSAPNYEVKADVGANNVYDVIVRASDGVTTATQSIAITVTNVIEPFAITSAGGGDAAAFIISENDSAGFTVATNEGGNLTFSIVGGVDAARFRVGATGGGSGTIQFVAPPNYEAPTDSNGDNVYQLVVQVSGGGYTDSQSISLSVLNVDEAPIITSNGAGATAVTSISENTTAVTTVVATDPENSAIAFSISGGADAAKFTINATTGALAFLAAPNFEVKADVGANNVYDVIVRASDGFNIDTQAIAVSVVNVNEAPVITSSGGGDTASLSIAENTTAVTTVTSTDPENNARTYSIAGGADASKFTINASTGVLSFLAAPDYDNPSDVGANNVYEVIVRASDGTLIDTQAIAVAVTNVNEAPVITSDGAGASAALTVAENSLLVATVASADPENTARSYSIAGGADAAKFAIDSVTGALSFLAAPNFESPADVGANNVYDVVVRASDGSLADTQALAVTIANVNEAPVITSGGGGASASLQVDENNLAVTTVQAGDPDGTAPAFAIAGGADAALFAIDSATGALTFLAAPDFEAPADADGDNVYLVTVSAGDGGLFDLQDLSISVADVFDEGKNPFGEMVYVFQPDDDGRYPMMTEYFV